MSPTIGLRRSTAARMTAARASIPGLIATRSALEHGFRERARVDGDVRKLGAVRCGSAGRRVGDADLGAMPHEMAHEREPVMPRPRTTALRPW